MPQPLTLPNFLAAVAEHTGCPMPVDPDARLDSGIGCTGDDAVEFLDPTIRMLYEGARRVESEAYSVDSVPIVCA